MRWYLWLLREGERWESQSAISNLRVGVSTERLQQRADRATLAARSRRERTTRSRTRRPSTELGAILFYENLLITTTCAVGFRRAHKPYVHRVSKKRLSRRSEGVRGEWVRYAHTHHLHLRVAGWAPRAVLSACNGGVGEAHHPRPENAQESSAWTHPAFPTNRVWPPLESVATRVWSNRTLRYAAPRAALPSGATAAP